MQTHTGRMEITVLQEPRIFAPVTQYPKYIYLYHLDFRYAFMFFRLSLNKADATFICLPLVIILIYILQVHKVTGKM